MAEESVQKGSRRLSRVKLPADAADQRRRAKAASRSSSGAGAKIAIMSDVHSNPQALEAALEDARKLGCGRFMMLGDTTGYGYDVKGALKLVRENFDEVLMGNHDSACVGLEPAYELALIRNYDIDVAQRSMLSNEELKWLKSRPYVFEGDGFACSHGDFVLPSAWGYIMTVANVRKSLLVRNEPLLFCGHTHHAAVWRESVDGEIVPVEKRRLDRVPLREESIRIKLGDGVRHIINVGSVGYPRNDFCIVYAIYEPDAKLVTIRRIPFDFKGYINGMLSAQITLPRWLLDLLRAMSRN